LEATTFAQCQHIRCAEHARVINESERERSQFLRDCKGNAYTETEPHTEGVAHPSAGVDSSRANVTHAEEFSGSWSAARRGFPFFEYQSGAANCADKCVE
jgi:hypothetical protein